MTNPIDINFDFRSDTPTGKDPDARSPTLRQYHKTLWSKPLPDGTLFSLTDTQRYAYLYHQSELGTFYLSSDTMSQPYRRHRSMQQIRNEVDTGLLSEFRDVMYVTGNMIIFPGNKIKGVMTINQARGCNGRIRDRFDLTLECIRRHYVEQESPLTKTLNAYSDFLALFRDFKGYVDFFLLQDLVTDGGRSVEFFLPFEEFGKQSPYPDSVDRFETFLRNATEFIHSRNFRIMQATMPSSRTKPRKCPACGGKSIASFLYGMPAYSEKLRADLDSGKVVLGGCCIWDDQPTWKCNNCDVGIHRSND
jgi:hypothetical protein